MASEADDTVRLNRSRAGGPWLSRAWPFAAGFALAAGLAAGGAWWALRPPAPAVPQPPAQIAAAPLVSAAPVAQPQPSQPVLPQPAPQQPVEAYAPPLASEAEILADAPEQMAVYRFAPRPAILVLQFPNLAEQGRMLNRVAALIEKRGFPRDRVLPDAELLQRILASGETPDTFYYGHDYRSADLLRFFALAGATPLTAEEERLRSLMGKLGWREGGPEGALISLVRQTPAPEMDAAARATILRHELSHGFYFTDPQYAAFSQRFWDESLTGRERAAFTDYLAKEGYDPALPDLIVNETQAYLMHTSDPRFFTPAAVGLSESRADALRAVFLAGMPPGWLRDCTAPAPAPAHLPAAATVPAGASSLRAPRERQRGGREGGGNQRRGLVRTIIAPVATRDPRRDAASRAARRSRT